MDAMKNERKTNNDAPEDQSQERQKLEKRKTENGNDEQRNDRYRAGVAAKPNEDDRWMAML